jgi:putative membrane protein
MLDVKSHRIKLILLCSLLLGAATPALLRAHELDESQPGPQNLHEALHTWGWEPGSLAGLALTAALYGVGLWRFWCSAGIGHGIRRREAFFFAAGWLVLFIALVSPIHPLGQVLFSVHMVQHELLMLGAAPLLVLSRPMVAFLRALPPGLSGALARVSNTPVWRRIWSAITAPLIAWLIHAIVLWIWHAPALFQATLHNEWIHASQHLSFLLSSLLFWWALLHSRGNAYNYGAGVLYLFTTAIHSGLLGALLTFARTIWYPDYAHTTQSWGLSPLEDQQVGGLIMWVPACTVYIVGGLLMVVGLLRQSERQALRRETLSNPGLPSLLATERSRS